MLKIWLALVMLIMFNHLPYLVKYRLIKLIQMLLYLIYIY